VLDVGGGVSLHMNCVGSGAPTVVMDAGHGNDGSVWIEVQEEVGLTTRVCVYDRAGLGGSSQPPPRPHTLPQMVRELHALLERAGVGGPYVLVGHSLGGVNSQLFASQYPNEVVGMVLVDSPTAFDEGVVSHQSVPPTDAEIAEAREQARKDPEGFDSGVTFRADLARLLGLSMGDKPLIVLSHGRNVPGWSPENTTRWEQGQAKLLTLSTNSVRIVGEKSGHNIYMDQPKLVIASIRQVVEAARTHGRVDGSALTAFAREGPPEPDVASVETAVFESFTASDPKRLFDLFGPAMRAFSPAGKTAEFMTGVLRDHGAWRAAERTAAEDPTRTGTWRVHADRGDLRLMVAIDALGRISGFDVSPVEDAR
jgi:pimeloyl-ACP methyl ester carboxylesterase